MNLVNCACERLLYKLSLFNAHATTLIFYIFMNVNKLCLNQIPEVGVQLPESVAGNTALVCMTASTGVGKW